MALGLQGGLESGFEGEEEEGMGNGVRADALGDQSDGDAGISGGGGDGGTDAGRDEDAGVGKGLFLVGVEGLGEGGAFGYR